MKKDHPWWMEIDPQAEVESLPDVKQAKQKIRELDDLEMNMSEEFFENLHDKIMSQVEKTEIKPVSRRQLPRKIKVLAASISLILFILSVSTVRSAEGSLTVSDPVTTHALNNVDDLMSSILVQSSADQFFVDVAQNKMNDLVLHELEKQMGRKRHSN